MSLFSGLKNLLQRETTRPVVKSASEARPREQPIEFVDARGTRVFVARQEYQARVLPEMFADANTDPDALYLRIIQALDDGFANACIEPARRLVEIDPSTERSHTVLGIALLKNQLLNEAETVLTQYIKDRGDSAVVLTNLAKVYAEQGRTSLANQTLWKSLTLNPNIANAVGWYAAIAQESSGEAAYLQALHALAALPGSWQPQLWLARHDLEHGRKDEALAAYREALPRATIAPEALMMISGDLGKNGCAQEALQLVLPVFDIRVHGYKPALNLLQACVQLRERQTGNRLLDDLRNLHRPDLLQYVQHFEHALARA